MQFEDFVTVLNPVLTWKMCINPDLFRLFINSDQNNRFRLKKFIRFFSVRRCHSITAMFSHLKTTTDGKKTDMGNNVEIMRSTYLHQTYQTTFYRSYFPYLTNFAYCLSIII